MLTLSDAKKMDQGLGKMSEPVSVAFSGIAGLMCGEWLSFGAPDLPGDQRVSSQFQVLTKCRLEVSSPFYPRHVGTPALWRRIFTFLASLSSLWSVRLIQRQLRSTVACVMFCRMEGQDFLPMACSISMVKFK